MRQPDPDYGFTDMPAPDRLRVLIWIGAAITLGAALNLVAMLGAGR